ncbi:MAG: TetR/AcrR family transcriptional regulator [Solirubrobacterales bacterium]
MANATNQSEASRDGTRERILRAALQLISDEGMPAISNRRLASEVGVALGSLTYHFPSQVDLLNESLLLLVDETVTRIKELARAIRESEMSIAQVAEDTGEVMRNSGMVNRSLAEMELHLHSARQPELREASIRCFDAYDELATAVLESLGVDRASDRAPAVVAVLLGAAVRQLGTGQRDASTVTRALMAMAAGIGAVDKPDG